MEAMRSIIMSSEEEWNDDSSSALSRVSSGVVCSDDFMTQLLNNDSCPARSNFTSYWQLGHDSTYDNSTNNNYDPSINIPSSSSLLYSSDFSHDHQNISVYHESYNLYPNYCNDDDLMLANNILEGGDDYTNQDLISNDSTLHSKEDRAAVPVLIMSNNRPAPTRKRPRINEQDQFHITQKTSGKQKKGSEDDRNNKKNIFHSSCSENEFNEPQEFNGSSSSPKGKTSVNLNGKKRANRGSATDPQSLYARKRRERINERLRILQTLIPNGTKVDISTMLEEAVHYVKFLQLQIKLLSSDEQWMYAPIAYNGMDIGLDHVKISTP